MRCARKRNILIPVLFLLCLAAEWGRLPAEPVAEETPGAFDSVKRQLVADGFDPAEVERLYGNPEVLFDTAGVSIFFTYSESKLNYDQFLSRRPIRNARKYLETHADELNEAETIYGVDKYVITAIILVETRLGTYLGNRAVFNTLSTMAALKDPAVKNRFWDQLDTDRRITRDRFNAKVKTKSEWAYRELKALLKVAAAEDFDPVSVRGSMAGAMGIAQFMPTNVLRLAKDGDKNGKIDLFTHADAIASVANYLKHHGWRKGLDRQAAYEVLLHYNYSKYYANTILAVADKLKG